MPSYTTIDKPTTTYSEIENVAQNYLLINSVGKLLINSSGDSLIISVGRDSEYTVIQKPS